MDPDIGQLDRQLAAIPKLAPVWTYSEMGWWPAFSRLTPAGNVMYCTVCFQLGTTWPPIAGSRTPTMVLGSPSIGLAGLMRFCRRHRREIAAFPTGALFRPPDVDCVEEFARDGESIEVG
ncbi:hypothetical protein K438DRAFT_1762433 [Mycena galopus ATCC 62051]|nr:hypothetical protein K438DRAFT_1762433 [Mycena galopus ATCC 62051]